MWQLWIQLLLIYKGLQQPASTSSSVGWPIFDMDPLSSLSKDTPWGGGANTAAADRSRRARVRIIWYLFVVNVSPPQSSLMWGRSVSGHRRPCCNGFRVSGVEFLARGESRKKLITFWEPNRHKSLCQCIIIWHLTYILKKSVTKYHQYTTLSSFKQQPRDSSSHTENSTVEKSFQRAFSLCAIFYFLLFGNFFVIKSTPETWCYNL